MKNEIFLFQRLFLKSVSRLFVGLLVCLINIYQKTLSFDTGILRFFRTKGSVCVFYPTCSVYSKEALTRLGLRRGIYLSVSRVLRCNPWQEPRVDEVPQK